MGQSGPVLPSDGLMRKSDMGGAFTAAPRYSAPAGFAHQAKDGFQLHVGIALVTMLYIRAHEDDGDVAAAITAVVVPDSSHAMIIKPFFWKLGWLMIGAIVCCNHWSP